MKALPLALLLLPALALSAPPPPGRISALLIPMDPTSESSRGADGDVHERRARPVRRLLRDEAARPLRPAGRRRAPRPRFKRAQKGYEESVKAFEARDYEDAERKVRATLKELEGSVAAMTPASRCATRWRCTPPSSSCGATWRRRSCSLIDLMALNPTFELNPKRFSREFITLRAQVATSRHLAAARQRHLQVPAGGRARLRGRRGGGLHAADAAHAAGGQAPGAHGAAGLPPVRADRGGDAGRRGGRRRRSRPRPPTRPTTRSWTRCSGHVAPQRQAGQRHRGAGQVAGPGPGAGGHRARHPGARHGAGRGLFDVRAASGWARASWSSRATSTASSSRRWSGWSTSSSTREGERVQKKSADPLDNKQRRGGLGRRGPGRQAADSP